MSLFFLVFPGLSKQWACHRRMLKVCRMQVSSLGFPAVTPTRRQPTSPGNPSSHHTSRQPCVLQGVEFSCWHFLSGG